MKKKTAKLREEWKAFCGKDNYTEWGDEPLTKKKLKGVILFIKNDNLKLTPVKYLWEKDIKIKEK